MKIKYQFANETVEIEVSEEWANVLVELDRQEYNANHKETRRHCSLEALNPGGAYLPAEESVEEEIFRKMDRDRLCEALERLKPRQRYLITQIFLEGRTYTDLANEEGVYVSAIFRTVERALEKLKKFL